MKKILVVDDEEDMVWSLQKNLRNDKLNAYVNTASSAERALKIIREVPIDLIVTDIRMPGMSGLDLLKEVKQHYPHIKILLMTAFPSVEYRKEAISKGCLDIVEKPFDINKLREIINKYLDSETASDVREDANEQRENGRPRHISGSISDQQGLNEEGRHIMYERRSSLNCWEFKNCGRQPQGRNVRELGVCPAAVEERLDGEHDGVNGGRTCWVVAGTLCRGEVQGTFAQKFKNCEKCDFYQKVKEETYPDFKLSATLRAKLRDSVRSVGDLIREITANERVSL